LGRICAKTFFTNGASVTLIDRDASRLESVKGELQQIKEQLSLKGEIKTIHGELGNKTSLQKVVAAVRETHSEIDILVHCAGIRKQNKIPYEVGEPLEKLFQATDSLEYEDIEMSFRVNVLPQYFLTSGLVDYLGAAAKKGGGRGCVICFSSVASKHNGQFVPAYQTTKASVDHLVKIMAAEFADFYSKMAFPNNHIFLQSNILFHLQSESMPFHRAFSSRI
jgi:NAD(P)-dependent dehydrogenase (short-subunit alcohol dehydrogenase family)